MTRTIMTIGICLMAVIFAPASSVLAQTETGRLLGISAGPAGESLEVHLVLQPANCTIKGRLQLKHPEDGRVVLTQRVSFDPSNRYTRVPYNFESTRTGRETVLVLFVLDEYDGRGRCRLRAAIGNYATDTGVSRYAYADDAYSVFLGEAGGLVP